MKRYLGMAAGLLVAGLAIAAMAQNVSNYMEQGGDRWAVGGSLDIVSGGDLDIESGATFKIDGSTVSATAAELDAYPMTVIFENVSTSATGYYVVPFTGSVSTVYSVLSGALATADATLTVSNAAAASMGTLTLAYSESAAGDKDSLAPSSNNSVTAGDVITIATDGASTNDVDAEITIIITR